MEIRHSVLHTSAVLLDTSEAALRLRDLSSGVGHVLKMTTTENNADMKLSFGTTKTLL